jgi:S-adenosylmethionine:tRNA ribosyltransferase-isomerase
MLRTEDLDYHLPEELIATTPAEPRDSARLLVLSRSDPARLEHRTVRDLPEVLNQSRAAPPQAAGGDLMVVNATRVLPARFRGLRLDTGGAVEGLFVDSTQPSEWTVLLKMRRMKPGVIVRLTDHQSQPCGTNLLLVERTGADNGAWTVKIQDEHGAAIVANPPDLLARIGLTPLPPYIRAARKAGHIEVSDDRDRETYQTVYATARGERPGHGSVAAPTAGLHFTPDLLARLSANSVQRAEVTLDVGLGTFKPVETEFVEQHPMHTEWCSVPEATARAIAAARDKGNRIIAVGTTAARTLESFDSPDEMLRAGSKETRLLITPGYRFRHVDVLMTNFHLPKSTLMAMVAAFLEAPGSDKTPEGGIARLRAAYAAAVRERYRFYSYGDAMLILP